MPQNIFLTDPSHLPRPSDPCSSSCIFGFFSLSSPGFPSKTGGSHLSPSLPCAAPSFLQILELAFLFPSQSNQQPSKKAAGDSPSSIPYFPISSSPTPFHVKPTFRAISTVQHHCAG
ncbi:hypothetical protein SLEP1_g25968 [Rubroshorea leprosula]|uniref:Uncharacterized protein n=1 Tax=Rubroshorea leprosula TaxID=152421 RepID=A0AAV5JRW8_9ROSI|nr:hypothetical protein SLEP1_g25968 [Rubroshorea leprosula]